MKNGGGVKLAAVERSDIETGLGRVSTVAIGKSAKEGGTMKRSGGEGMQMLDSHDAGWRWYVVGDRFRLLLEVGSG